tara:strand:- start:4663 stop:5649 length:987 start_codon:yes stop_codon:yes gene_type:complete
MKILVTGSAGFIGFHTAKFFLKKGHQVFGLDNLNRYYDINLKKARNKILLGFKNYNFKKININSFKKVENFFLKNKFDLVIHLAAQAGVRYSLKNPSAYIDTNLRGFFNIIENCKKNNIKKLIYASSSSVYGVNKNKFFKETDSAVSPIQLYAATKRSNELIAHAYSSLYKMNTIGLRFFTVYGPWGRPDMSFFLFTKKILNNEIIDVFNFGKHVRDFTYIDDVVRGIFLCSKKNLKKSKNNQLFNIVNIACGKPVKLINFISIIEKKLNKKSHKRFKNLQKGDVLRTAGSINKIKSIFGYQPITPIEVGIGKFVKWYKQFYYKKNKK